MLQKFCCRANLFLKRNSSTILTCVGAAGVIVTAVLTAKETPKAIQCLEDAKEEKGDELSKVEIVQTVAPIYIPAAITGLGTIACIFGANILNKRTQASLMSAYALLESSYKDYRKAAKAVYGDDADQKIQDEVVVEDAAERHPFSPGLFQNCDLGTDAHGEIKLFYESLSRRYFRSTAEQVIQAEYHFNRNFVLRGCAFLNEFYDFLGIKETKEGNMLGWTVEDEFYWVDFDHRKVELEDGMECYIIDTQFEPSAKLLEYGYY